MRIFDFDGVLRPKRGDVPAPKPGDIIITGRCIDEAAFVYDYLINVANVPVLEGIPVYFNPILYEARGNHTEEARKLSGRHKALIIKRLVVNGVSVEAYYEDDPLQWQIVLEEVPALKSKLVALLPAVGVDL